ncbi:MAG: F0F1 ATP synthase subunit delta [Nitrospirota bacterium]
MLIDWFTVGAQILNFLVLVYLLKHFLYGPIIKAMDEREKKIASRLQEADRKRKEAEEETASYRRKKRELDESRGKIFEETRKEAEKEKKELISDARREADELRSRWKDSFHDEVETFLRDLKIRTGRQVCEIARRALSDMSTMELEQHMITVFSKKIEGISKEDMEKIRSSLKNSADSIVIASAFELPTQNRRELTKLIHSKVYQDAEVTYKTIPELLCGIEMKVNGRVIGWNLNEYLDTFREDVRKALESDMEKVKGKSQEHTPDKEDVNQKEEVTSVQKKRQEEKGQEKEIDEDMEKNQNQKKYQGE